MRTYLRRSLVILVLFPLLAVLVVVSDHRFPAPSGPADDAPRAIVAMGDSTLSGEGAGTYDPATDGENGNWCHRSLKSTIDKTTVLGITKTFNIACSGANTEQVGTTQANRLQTIAHENRVAVIVVAVGANDDPRFADVLNSCLDAWVRRRDCNGQLAEEWRTRIDRMAPKVEKALRAIRAVMDQEGYSERSYSLVVQSYASPVSPDIPTDLQNLSACPLRTGDARWVRDQAVGELGRGIRQAARKVDARYLDLTRAGAGHEACTGGKNPDSEWFTRLAIDFEALRDNTRASHAAQESFHPNARGHAQIGRCLSEFLTTTARTAACVAQDGNLRAELNPQEN
jgi:lysophospholipase L1-like esterase